MAASAHITTRTASLKARAATLRERLDRHLPALSQARVDLLAAYAEQRAVMPLFDPMADGGTPEYRAAFRVERRLRDVLKATIEAPTPNTREGLATLALAMAIDAEGNLSGRRGDCEREYARAARALLAATGTALPAGFTGFGDETGFEAREAALMSGPVRLPAWASAEAARAA